MTKLKSIDLENIPQVLEKVTGLIDAQIEMLSEKTAFSPEDTKALIAYANALAYIYKEYRAEVLDTEAKLKAVSSTSLMKIIKTEAKRG